MPAQLPIQFACSGCSEAGQLVNQVDRQDEEVLGYEDDA